MSMKIKDILRRKGSEVITGTRDQTLLEAAQTMVSNRVGALVIVDDEGHPVGIITERDVLRRVAECPDCIRDDKVSDVMSKELIVVVPDDDTDGCLSLMTEKRMRHLPVLEDSNLVGLVSIGDIVKVEHADSKFEIHFMREYIMGKI